MSVARTIIHIGSHKTGTSFLQAHFHFNSAALLADGIYYPQLERTPYVHQHSSLAIALRAADKGPALNALASLRERAEEHRASTLFLSGEAFFFATPEEVAVLRQALAADGGSEFRILVYLRNTYDYVRSQLNQHLRFGDYTVTESEFLSRLAIYRPDDIIRRWEAEFGPENVDVFSYDEHKGRLLAHFGEAARIPRLRACSVTPEAVNRSIDFLCALLMNQLLFDKDVSVKAAAYAELVARHEVPGDHLYPREAAMIESILKQSRIQLSHPKLLQISHYLTSTPGAPTWAGREKSSIERMMATLGVILSVLEGG